MTPIQYENLKTVNQPFENELKLFFNKFLDSGHYVLGSAVSSFEEEFAQYIGTKYCVGVASGLDALFLSLKAYGFKEGSEVIVPSNTYIASVLAVLHAGLTPVLVEPDINTYNITARGVTHAITSKTVAVMPVHLYGRPCPMKTIVDCARYNNLRIIEDCAQSHGAMSNFGMTGTFDLGAFSFYPTKNLGCLGDGGAITTNDPDMYVRLKKLRNYGRNTRYLNEIVGFNSRLDEIQAGFLSIKLRHLNAINTKKRQLAEIYHTGLKRGVLPVDDSGHVYHIFNIRTPHRYYIKRCLEGYNIMTEIHYPTPLNKQPALPQFHNLSLPIAEEICDTTLSLPISYGHTEEEIRKVIEVLSDLDHPI